MKKRDKKFILQFTLQTIQRIEYHVHGQSYRAFLRDQMRQDAVIFRLEILSYALRDLHKILRECFENQVCVVNRRNMRRILAA